ncbi:UDP-N-acetylglucosamine 2-epimerase [Providencia sp. wls1916]|uniref:UDP-N-acetylglucosamine 2-epimerase n=1 Tax=Providencia sp. wls1916 TaxID=2675155 RepID=UPI0012B66802|nr:UDP-N-acetylglucosamine 2-epimerase [Providencia sp. wls1916]MTC78879.1 UDP-N-acetylglucosamine 2-epimerase (hydrolyzing) [Providencia sp. wls1916]
MKKLLYVTGSRAEYGIMKRLLVSFQNDIDIDLTLVATGMHCDESYGYTYKIIENDGFIIDQLIDIDIDTSNNGKVLHSMSICLSKFGEYFQENKFDSVIILGDRYEIYSVAIAAAMHNIPIIHIHGGEQTLGNYDEFIRHSITKMAKLHLCSTEEYRSRVIQLGERPESVFNVGALGAENSLLLDLPSKSEITKKYGNLDKPYFVVLFHPETLTRVSITEQTIELLSALNLFKDQFDFIFIGSNSDTGSDKIKDLILDFSKKNNYRYLKSVTTEDYLALNKYSCGLIGNSSSGIIEIPSLKIPTINIGMRQAGRVRGETVIDCLCDQHDIINSINKCRTNEFQNKIISSSNPYYQGNVLEKMINIIKDFLYSKNDNIKTFYDIK